MSEMRRFQIRCPDGTTIPHVGTLETATAHAEFLTQHFGARFDVILPEPVRPPRLLPLGRSMQRSS